MKFRTPICAMAMAMAVAAACGGGTASAETPKQPQPAPTPKARVTRAAAWSTAPAKIAWPATSRKRVLIVSRGWAPDQFYVWFIADGREVVAAYVTNTRAELDSAIARFVIE